MTYRNSDIQIIIDDYIHSIRDRDIMKMRYVDGLTYEKIAERVDMSTRQIQNIINKHEKIIFKALGL